MRSLIASLLPGACIWERWWIVTLWKTFGLSEGTYFAKMKMPKHPQLCSKLSCMFWETMKVIFTTGRIILRKNASTSTCDSTMRRWGQCTARQEFLLFACAIFPRYQAVEDHTEYIASPFQQLLSPSHGMAIQIQHLCCIGDAALLNTLCRGVHRTWFN